MHSAYNTLYILIHMSLRERATVAAIHLHIARASGESTVPIARLAWPRKSIKILLDTAVLIPESAGLTTALFASILSFEVTGFR